MNPFSSNIISIYGEKGKALSRRSLGEGGWLDELPQIVATISSKLDLRDLKEKSLSICFSNYTTRYKNLSSLQTESTINTES